MYKSTTLLFVILFFSKGVKAQEINQNRKKMNATRVSSPPKIDGIINEALWTNVPVAKDFIMLRPTNGEKAPNTHKTEVKLVYDDQAIYVSAKMYTPDTSLIPAEFNSRDNIGNSDFFMLMINPNDDGQNPTMFIVTASGVQVDSKVSSGNEDYNWNAVWKSAIKVNADHWAVEMKIPYRALRFANRPIQSWGVNFHREVKNLNARFTWNPIDNTQGSWTQYDGLIENFKNITPPTRLNFYPYASATTTSFEGKTDFDWSVGMDVKYGLTENFTLDATLIPDFGQVGFDDVSLNLGPFEQQFSEQRQFFTEGTELFTKGRLFYSRRIGGAPIASASVDENTETLIDSPEKVQMLNAIKISGRTKKGLGIGFFNAITDVTEAKIQNNDTKEIRTEVLNPFSNYNILVLDQQFNQNSSVTLINTNVTRNGNFRDANVSGLLWHVEDKGSNYNIDGSFKMSNIYDDEDNPNTGYTFDTSVGKQSGNWRGEIGYNFENKDFNPNDLGILFNNNEQTLYGFASYETLKPKGIFNSYRISTSYNINFLHESGTYIGRYQNLSFRAQTKNRFGFGGNINYNSESKDFNEPRQGNTSGIYFKRPQRVNINHWGSTDYRKKFAIDYDWYYNFFKDNPKEGYGFRVSPRYRFNNKFSLIYAFRYNQTNNDQGFTTEVSQSDIDENATLAPFLDETIFGQRDWTTYNNSLTGKYSFSTRSSLSMSFRHNWSKVPYENQYYTLGNEGELIPSDYNDNNDTNFNSWNLDVNYLWQFAPGSQLIAFYRNSISNFNDNANQNFSENLNSLLKESNRHTFSVRFVYFIDYNNLKNIF
ncbi:carbohydrate binding family 9 domain-containing protein [Tenacibaculum sp. AHE15PA]|uniref:DUF5916 domain-containing protein n=1 Tax=unclassified Tenacibaculum TaxID=2635139 RepID=UPI001C4F927C|nr:MULTISPECIES: DUF5916 domain-containing protein [unclassified Tenacibaculum]QXP74350.1 carbohydrate binding family 9 domain-containing protein [Tenacibaculum sp. AHE14PA]QXP75280.1 carbohydrate binding family 9 domain-containing protein [Tenacibaculum sp. AHE15PA]